MTDIYKMPFAGVNRQTWFSKTGGNIVGGQKNL